MIHPSKIDLFFPCSSFILQGRKVWFLNQESKWAQGLLHSICDMEAMVSLQDGQVSEFLILFALKKPPNPLFVPADRNAKAL